MSRKQEKEIIKLECTKSRLALRYQKIYFLNEAPHPRTGNFLPLASLMYPNTLCSCDYFMTTLAIQVLTCPNHFDCVTSECQPH